MSISYIIVIIIVILVIYNTLCARNVTPEDLYDGLDAMFTNKYPTVVNIAKNLPLRYKVCFFSYDDRGLAKPYIKEHYISYSSYCDRYPNYDFVFQTSGCNTPPYWCKMFLMQQLMITRPHYDIYAWVDSDTVIGRPNTSVEDILDSNPRKDVYLTTKYIVINTGVMFFRNTPEAARAINYAIDYYKDKKDRCLLPKGKLKGMMGVHCYEQVPMTKYAKGNPNVGIMGNDIVAYIGAPKDVQLGETMPYIIHMNAKPDRARNAAFSVINNYLQYSNPQMLRYRKQPNIL